MSHRLKRRLKGVQRRLPFSRLRRLNGVVDPARYDDPQWAALHDELETYALGGEDMRLYLKHVFRATNGQINRKGYEWTHCLYGLHKLGAIHPEARALGVGCGREPILYYLADRVRHVVASDLYGGEAWSANWGAEADIDVAFRPQAYCPRPAATERIGFTVADGTRLPFTAGAFDLVWSLSSIEHFGGHAAARGALLEMARVLKPGGIACVATELLLLPEYRHDEYFSRAELEALMQSVRPALEPTGPVAYESLPRAYLIDSQPLPQNRHRRRRAVVCNDGEVQWTSVVLFFRRTRQAPPES
jgi:SAM-dependent methyltransferase